jgi:hypothetical protein
LAGRAGRWGNAPPAPILLIDLRPI